MSVRLTLACGRTDRTGALFSGEAVVAGVELFPLALPPSEIFPRALRRAEFDICELSASSYLVQLSRGESQYVALPVVLSRSFRLDSLYVRKDRGIEVPADLRGRTIGTPEFQMTAGVWLRGMLQEHFGLDHLAVSYVTGGLNAPGRKERIPVRPATGVSITPIGAGVTLDEMLRRGEIDAVMAPEPPACFFDPDVPVGRIFADSRNAEQDFFARIGIFPIMHLLVVRAALLEAEPDLARRLYDAFLASRDAGYRQLEKMASAPTLPLMLPWLAAELARTRHVLGRDHWPYGVSANRDTLEALCRYSSEQGLSARRIAVDELFHPSLLHT